MRYCESSRKFSPTSRNRSSIIPLSPYESATLLQYIITINTFYVCVFRVDEKLRVKLADSGLSRDLFPDDYSCLNDNENRPIKWMALESITSRAYNGASDIVSRFQCY